MPLRGSSWRYILIYIHLSFLICKIRSSIFSGLLHAQCVKRGIRKLQWVWQFERLYLVMIPFILVLPWVTKHFPILSSAFWKQTRIKEKCIFFSHSPKGCQRFHFHSIWSLIQLLCSFQMEQHPRLHRLCLLSCLFTQNTSFSLHSYFIWSSRLDHHLYQKCIPIFRRAN